MLPPISFYVPASSLHAKLPLGLADYRVWANEAHAQKHFTGVGKFNWILQTYFHLAAAGFPCALVHQLPDEGIVVSHRHFLQDWIKPGPRRYFVCVLADKEEPGNVGRHWYAQAHVVQNPRDPLLTSPTELWFAAHVPFWTQIDLRPRSAARGDRFENIGFFGIENNLAEELKHPAWFEAVRARGMTFTRVPRGRWHDYSETDLVVGIRGFGAEAYHYKPATKLHNAWHAGVPAVMGRDSAYAAERASDLDYLEVGTMSELEAALDRLAAAPLLRREMSDHGRGRADETSDARITAIWRDFLVDEAVPRYQAWRALGEPDQAALWARRDA